MSLSLVAAIVGALTAAAGTGMLARRCLAVPGVALAAWTVALLGLLIALIAQVAGHAVGFGPTTFRVMALGAQVIAPLALCLGLAEVAGRSIQARFAARLVLSALVLVAIVILGSDPLSATAFSKAWPSPAVHYQIIPNKLLEYLLAPVTVVIALIAGGVTAARPGRDRAWREALPPVTAAGVAALVLSVPALAQYATDHLGLTLPVSSLFAVLCLLASGLTWFAGIRVSGISLDVLHERAAENDDNWGPRRSWDRDPDEADYPDRSWPGDDRSRHAGSDEYQWRDDELDNDGRASDRDDYGGGFRDAAPGAGYDEYGDDTGYGEARAEPGYPASGRSGVPAGMPSADALAVGGRDAGGHAAGGRDAGGHAAGGRDAGGQERLLGQIAIYTLLDDRTDEFDRLIRKVVKQVRSQEPDTLVYIVHEVPSAPLQRILYEVYRDRNAFEAHKRQPHVMKFEADRRPYVLATNVIELGLQQAKVSPLPSITDLLSDTGYDLLSDTGFGQPGFGPSPRRDDGYGNSGGPARQGGPVGHGPRRPL